jgi:chitinase
VVGYVLKRLAIKGIPIKGLMTWSVNWDNGTSKDGVPYNWEFSRRYGPLIQGVGSVESGVDDRLSHVAR